MAGEVTGYQDMTGGNVLYGDDGVGSWAEGYMPSLTEQMNLQKYNDSLGFDYGSAFDTGLDLTKGVLGVIGTLDKLKTNKLMRKGLDQNIRNSAAAEQRTVDFVNGTKSAFA